MKKLVHSSKPLERVDCLGLGIMPLDFLFEIDDYPPAGGKRDATALTVQGGGPVPNVLVGLQRLGHSTALITAVADDLAGKIGVEEIAREGVDTRFIVRKTTGQSLMAGGFVERGSGRRTIVLYRNIHLRLRDVVTLKLPIPHIVHLDGRDLKACIKLARWGRSVGATICFDIGSTRNDVSPILPLVDHLVVADAFALPFTGCRTARKALLRLRNCCPGTVVVTEGTKGSLGCEAGPIRLSGKRPKLCQVLSPLVFDERGCDLTRSFKPDKLQGQVTPRQRAVQDLIQRGKRVKQPQLVRQPAYRVRNVDTTGAGDAFHTGYIYGLLNGYDLAARMRFGAATAALKCTRPGARAGAPTLKQVKDFLRRDPPTYA